MKCERAKELFSDYLEGSMDYALAETVRGHIGKCPSCKAEYERFENAYTALNMMPEIEPPVDFRHNIIMQLAKAQHEKSHSRQSVFDLNWSQIWGRMISPRGIATACAGMVFAAILLHVPQNVYRSAAGIFKPDVSVISMPNHDNSIDRDKPIIQNTAAGMKNKWLSRKLIRNTVWTEIQSKQNGPDITLYTVGLSINRKALVKNDSISSIDVNVYAVPPDQFDLKEVKNSEPFWRGTITDNSPVLIPVTVYQSTGTTGSVNLLVTWSVNDQEFGQLIYLPSRSTGTEKGAGYAPDSPDEPSLYSALQSVSQDFCVPVVVNANLRENPQSANPGAGTLDKELNGLLKQVGLDWLYSDKAVYIDRKYNVNPE